jgi:hypothetical protein
MSKREMKEMSLGKRNVLHSKMEMREIILEKETVPWEMKEMSCLEMGNFLPCFAAKGRRHVQRENEGNYVVEGNVLLCGN